MVASAHVEVTTGRDRVTQQIRISTGRLDPRRRFVDRPYPGGESYRDCVEKMRSFLTDVAREFDGSRVLVIAHSAQRWALRHLLEGLPLEELVDAPFEWREGWEYLVPTRAHG